MLYRDLREMVQPSHACLVVWDVQNALVKAIFNRGLFLKNLKGLIAAARQAGVSVVYTKITPLPVAYESPWRLYLQMKRAGVDDPAKLPSSMQPGSLEAEIPTEVAPIKNDMVLDKHTASIFIGTHFEYMMRNRRITTLIFTGISTEIGVDSSARDAANRGFYTIVANDCVSSSDQTMHEATLKILPRICLVMPAAEIVREWK